MREPYILISIRDPDKRPVRIRHCSLCKGFLELVFHDAEPVEGFVPTDPIIYMTDTDARTIWRFLYKYEGDYEVIVVHCEQGMSRSPAIAAALATVLTPADQQYLQTSQPNRYVYECMLSASEGLV